MRSLLMTVAGALLLGAAAKVLEPSALIALTKPSTQTAADARTLHDEFVRSLAVRIGDGVEVLAAHNHSTDTQASLVLWVDDANNPGVIDPDEIAVITHSQSIGAVAVYSKARAAQQSTDGGREPALNGQNSPPRQADFQARLPGRFDGPLDRAVVSAPVFCLRWRTMPAVQAQTIASNISDMRMEPLGGPDQPLAVLRLWLTWSANSSDGAGEASALVDFSRRRVRAGGQQE